MSSQLHSLGAILGDGVAIGATILSLSLIRNKAWHGGARMADRNPCRHVDRLRVANPEHARRRKFWS